VKFPFGDRTVTRGTFWQGPLFQIRNHYGQLVVYLRMNGIVPPTTTSEIDRRAGCIANVTTTRASATHARMERESYRNRVY